MKSRAFLVATIFLTVLCGDLSAADQTPSPVRGWFPIAPPLSQPSSRVIPASTVNELFQAARDVKPGGTILLADGHYMLPRYVELRTDNVTLRSKSGQRERVVIDGARIGADELTDSSKTLR